jgi:hypothetical protein
MPSRKKKLNRFLVVYDMLGLESIFDIDHAMETINNYEKQLVWSKLKGEEVEVKKPNPIPLQHILLRARVNLHRSYEIYTFSTSMSMAEVREQFDNDPQPIVNWIRDNGMKIYSDYSKKIQPKIF